MIKYNNSNINDWFYNASDIIKVYHNGAVTSGTFTKAASMSSWTTGNNGIPRGWTVQDYSG